MTMGFGKNVLRPAHVKQYSLSLAKICSMPACFVVFFLLLYNTGCFVPDVISSFKTRCVMHSF
jgi:hypothetical protein